MMMTPTASGRWEVVQWKYKKKQSTTLFLPEFLHADLRKRLIRLPEAYFHKHQPFANQKSCYHLA